MNNTNCFTDRALHVGLNITLESRHIIHAISKLFIKPNCPEFGTELDILTKS